MMNEGQFMALRAEAQETNSLLKQILAEQKRTNEALDKIVAPLPTFDMSGVDLDSISPSQGAVMLPGGSKVERVTTAPKTATKKGK